MSNETTDCKLSVFDPIYQFTGKLFSRWPFLVLFASLFISVTLTWTGLVRNGLPEFDDPYLGFETRYTSISNRLAALGNLRYEVNRLRILENYPGEKITEREYRRKRDNGESETSESSCTPFPLEEYGRVALEIKDGKETFSRVTILLICYFQKLVETMDAYPDLCELKENRQCCSMWSLPNYISQWSKKTDCADLKEEDIHNFKIKLHHCMHIYSNDSQNEECIYRRETCPEYCHQGGIFHSALYTSLDRTYSSKNTTKYTMIVLPVPKTSQTKPLLEYFQNQLMNIQLPNESTSVAGFDFGGKDALFKSYLISDLQYMILASVIIFIIVCCYTKSFFVTVISFGVLTLSIGVSYYLYIDVFKIPYFPFMNMLVTIILLGIGTDATLIFSVVWERNTEKNLIDADKSFRERCVIATLSETTPTLFVTTCTTAGAFFASLYSSITTIRCFSIFAGTAIIVSFILLYLCVPTSLVLSNIIWRYLRSLINSHPEHSKVAQKTKNPFFSKISNFFSYFGAKISNVRSPNVLWILSFLIFTGILCWSLLIVFVHPGFQLPDTEQFQLLTSSHPVEKYELQIEPHFQSRKDDISDYKLAIYFVWGVKPLDNGYGLDPNDHGTLEFDDQFNLMKPSNQKWMKKLCKKIQSFSFYDKVINSVVGANMDSCFMDTMVTWMKRDCSSFVDKNDTYKPCCVSSKFPYDKSVFSQCIGTAARDVYRTPSFYFQPDIAGPKFHVTESRNTTNIDDLATFVVRVKTNFAYTVVYRKMEAFYDEVEESFNDLMSTAPEGLENGFFISSQLDFFDLQKSLLEETWTSVLLSVGLCFIFLWISSCSFTVAFGAVLSIFAIVIVTSAVLIKAFDWKLGVFESIAVTVAVGLSDFTAHHSLEFSKRKSVFNMTSPTFFSAISTIIMGLAMLLFSSVLVYQQIGSFFFVLVSVSWLYSICFLSPVLSLLDIIMTMCCSFFKNVFNERNEKIEPTNGDGGSCSDFIIENVTSTRVPDKKFNIMMEKWKLLKKFGQETTV